MAITKEQIISFCPSWRFHQYEKNFPCSVEYLCDGGSLNSLSGKFAPIELSKSNCQTELGGSAYATSAVENDVYVKINENQFGGEVSKDGAITAPMYYAVNEHSKYIDISYLVLYAFQDGVTVYASHDYIPKGTECIARNYGQHEGDLERVVVRVTSDGGSIIGVGFEAHGDLTWIPPSKCRFEQNSKHVIVNSALGGHSSWNMPPGKNDAYFVDETVYVEIGKIPLFIKLEFCSYINDAGKAWRAYNSTSGEWLRQLGLDGDGKPLSDQKWSTYCGRLGLIGIENSLDIDRCTYLDGGELSSIDKTIVFTLGKGGELFDKIPESDKNGDGPTGPGDRNWTRPGVPDVSMEKWSNGSNQWQGIETVLHSMKDSMTVNRFVTAGSKITADDARHLDARGFAFYLQKEPLEKMPSVRNWTMATSEGFQPDKIKHALSMQPLSMQPFATTTLTLDQIWACHPLITNRNDGGDDSANTFLFFPQETSAPTSRAVALDPKAWRFDSWADGSSGSGGIYNVANQLVQKLNNVGACSAGAKIAADDRRHGDARAFMFWNPTMTSDDVPIVLEPGGWDFVHFETRNAGDMSVPQQIVAILNGWSFSPSLPNATRVPHPPSVSLGWAQICASKVIFTNRQEGDDDGATFALFYPLLE